MANIAKCEVCGRQTQAGRGREILGRFCCRRCLPHLVADVTAGLPHDLLGDIRRNVEANAVRQAEGWLRSLPIGASVTLVPWFAAAMGRQPPLFKPLTIVQARQRAVWVVARGSSTRDMLYYDHGIYVAEWPGNGQLVRDYVRWHLCHAKPASRHVKMWLRRHDLVNAPR